MYQDDNPPIQWDRARWSVVATRGGGCAAVLKCPRQRYATGGINADEVIRVVGSSADAVLRLAPAVGVSETAFVAGFFVVAIVLGIATTVLIPVIAVLVAAATWAYRREVRYARLDFASVDRSAVTGALAQINADLDAKAPGSIESSQRVLGEAVHWSHTTILDRLDVPRLLNTSPTATPGKYPPETEDADHVLEEAAVALGTHGRETDARAVEYVAASLSEATTLEVAEFEQALTTIRDAYREAAALPDPAIAQVTVDAVVDAAMRHVRDAEKTVTGRTSARLEAARLYAEERWPDPRTNPLNLTKEDPDDKPL